VPPPKLATAFAFSGSLRFSPTTDAIVKGDGKSFKFQPPQRAELPIAFNSGEKIHQEPVTSYKTAYETRRNKLKSKLIPLATDFKGLNCLNRLNPGKKAIH